MTGFLGFIDDGMTLTRFIVGVPRIHHACRITFRPAPPTDHSLIARQVDKLSGNGQDKQASDLIYKTIADRMVSWEFLNDDGKPLDGAPELSLENIKKMTGAFQDRLVMIVYIGKNDGGDDDPWVTEDSKNKSNTTPGLKQISVSEGNFERR